LNNLASVYQQSQLVLGIDKPASSLQKMVSQGL